MPTKPPPPRKLAQMLAHGLMVETAEGKTGKELDSVAGTAGVYGYELGLSFELKHGRERALYVELLCAGGANPVPPMAFLIRLGATELPVVTVWSRCGGRFTPFGPLE